MGIFSKKPIYVIEHLDNTLGKWSLIEYEHISQVVGRKNVWFTNIKKKDMKKLDKFGRVFSERFVELGINMKEVCVLDPDAKEMLSKKDNGRLRYFIFGGILGDYPPKKRTKKELTKFLPGSQTRNIGKKQFSTDNAVFVSKKMLDGQAKDLKFMDKVELKFNEFESVILPFRYPVVDGKPFMSEKIVNYLRNKKGF